MAQTVLVVDDDPMAHRVLKHYLEQAGYQLITARSGPEAIDMAMRDLPELIIMDVLMPGMDGLEALRQLKDNAATQRIPVVVLTSSAFRLTELESAASGAASFLAKPFSKSQLLALVRKLVAKPAVGGESDAASK
jgi:CheY-like chemotaxis protein